jgi:hypothetical protein
MSKSYPATDTSSAPNLELSFSTSKVSTIESKDTVPTIGF